MRNTYAQTYRLHNETTKRDSCRFLCHRLDFLLLYNGDTKREIYDKRVTLLPHLPVIHSIKILEVAI